MQGKNLLSPETKIRNTSEIDRYDASVLKASANKSFIRKMAEKGGKSKKDEMDSIIEEEVEKGMSRSRAPLGKSVIPLIEE